MTAISLLHVYLQEQCPEIHASRLQSVIDVATALQLSQNLSLTAIGRQLKSDTDIKYKIKKVDRLMGNQHLYNEVSQIYSGLSKYLFQYLAYTPDVALLVDLCFLKDGYDIQMLSAEVATQGRSIPIYRDVFEKKHLKGRAKEFISKLSAIIPPNRKIIIVMDAGFGDTWFEEVEKQGWYWLVRARKKKFVQLEKEGEWRDVADIFPLVGIKGKSYDEAYITKGNPRACRIITKKFDIKTVRKQPKKLPRNYNAANGNYQRIAKEPWVLATNLPKEYNTTQVLGFYKKRMQIEESFRDIKSHQYGLSGRYIQSRCLYRWSIAMLLAAIVQLTVWIIGVVGHSLNYQRKFQANTVKDRKVFSYFYLGMLIVEHKMIEELQLHDIDLTNVITTELQREW